MTNIEKTDPTAWREKLEYVRLARAAKMIGCPVDELLHLGAIGEVTVLAPVVAEGEYEWPVSETGEKSWYEPFRGEFDSSDRVILHRRDVAKIEAIGWVIPRLFFAPEVAFQIAGRLQNSTDDANINAHGLSKEIVQVTNARVKRQSNSNTVGISAFLKLQTPQKEDNSSSEDIDGDAELSAFALMVAHADTVPWFPVDTRLPIEVLRANTVSQIEDTGMNRTKIEHLFLSMAEIKRLQENTPQDGAAELRNDAIAVSNKPHGNGARFSNSREEVLMAAIACLFNVEEIKIKASRWAEIIDEKGAVFWKKGNPPLEPSVIARLLSKAKAYPDCPEWDGKE